MNTRVATSTTSAAKAMVTSKSMGFSFHFILEPDGQLVCEAIYKNMDGLLTVGPDKNSNLDRGPNVTKKGCKLISQRLISLLDLRSSSKPILGNITSSRITEPTEIGRDWKLNFSDLTNFLGLRGFTSIFKKNRIFQSLLWRMGSNATMNSFILHSPPFCSWRTLNKKIATLDVQRRHNLAHQY